MWKIKEISQKVFAKSFQTLRALRPARQFCVLTKLWLRPSIPAREAGGGIDPYRISTPFGDFVSLQSQNQLKRSSIPPRKCEGTFPSPQTKIAPTNVEADFCICGDGGYRTPVQEKFLIESTQYSLSFGFDTNSNVLL